MHVVEMTGITKSYPKVVANQNVSIYVDEGEILGLIGENGAGKSTLMKILYGLEQPDEGEIRLFGKPTVIDSPNQAIRLGIGMVHQHFMLMPNSTVLQNIILGNEPVKKGLIDRAAAVSRIREIMDTYNLQVDLDQRIYQLSVGEKQRVEIVKALYREAKILVLDEPTAVLTPQETDKLMDVLRKLKGDGTSIIFITHKLREVMAITDRITVMRRGIVTGNLVTKDSTVDMLSEPMVGRKVVLDDIPRKEFSPGKEVLRVEGLTALNPKGITALKGVSFTVREGEIVGIAGVEGNGQTELVETISGLLKPESGDVYLKQENITKKPIRKRREMGMAHIPEDRLKVGTARTCTIRDNLVMNRYYQKEYAKAGVMDNKKLLALAEKLCVEHDVKTPNSTYLLNSLSGGNMQKVVLAREMETDPDLLLAAQPTRGVDIGAIENIWGRLIAARDSGKAVLLVSAELDEILALADRILVFYEGEIMAELRRGEADEKEIGLYMTGAKRQTRKEGADE